MSFIEDNGGPRRVSCYVSLSISTFGAEKQQAVLAWLGRPLCDEADEVFILSA